jgi:hypothetical protein
MGDMRSIAVATLIVLVTSAHAAPEGDTRSEPIATLLSVAGIAVAWIGTADPHGSPTRTSRDA